MPGRPTVITVDGTGVPIHHQPNRGMDEHRTMSVCLSRVLLLMTLTLSAATSAFAQYPMPRRAASAVGENYRVEFSAFLWEPPPEIVVQSSVLDLPATTVDLAGDLGVEKQYLPEFRGVIRAARKHKFRASYIPIKYTAETTLEGTIVFNGTIYRVGVPVTADFEWRAFRFGYEYDFVSRDRGFVGLIVEAKYTDVKLELAASGLSETAEARVPIPAIGGIFRVYPARNVSLTGEFTGFTLPGDLTEGDDTATYLDWDIYGTVNFTNNVGVQAGYRTLDLSYRYDEDFGDFKLEGFYFGGVVRF